MMRKRILRTAALLLCLGLLLVFPAAALEPGEATVNATNLNFRDAPGMWGNILAVLPSEATVELLEDLGEWCRIRWDGREGYVYSSYLLQAPAAPAPAPEPEPEAEEAPAEEEKTWPAAGFINGNAVRFRVGPGLAADIYGFLYAESRVTVLGIEEDWTHVEFQGRIGYVYSDYVTLLEESSVSDDEALTEAILQTARDNLGAPYRYGGTTPEGFDCSGFVYYCFGENGITLQRTASYQYNDGVALTDQGDLRPGDLVFFATTGIGSIGHVGIYLGDREFIHASSGSLVIKIDSMDDRYWSTTYYGACRVLNE